MDSFHLLLLYKMSQESSLSGFFPFLNNEDNSECTAYYLHVFHPNEPYLGNIVLSVKCGGPFTMYSPSEPRTKETK